jgi:hypothetical protein
MERGNLQKRFIQLSLTFAILLLSSCTARRDVRKARKQSRHERKAEYFRVKAGLPECKDTVVHDTMVVPKAVHDTTFSVTHDTTHHETERVVIKHFYDHETETVYLEAECKEVKEIHTVETIERTKTEYRDPPWLTQIKGVLRYWWVLLVLGLVTILAITTIKVLKKIGI